MRHTIETAFGGLKANKSRSGLTILGIVIGITAIMVVMSVGRGAESLILNQIEGIGATSVFVEPGREPKGPSDFAEAFTDSIKDREVTALRKLQSQGLEDLSPMVMLAASVVYERETQRGSIQGIGPLIFSTLKLEPEEGLFFTEDDVRRETESHEKGLIIIPPGQVPFFLGKAVPLAVDNLDLVLHRGWERFADRYFND